MAQAIRDERVELILSYAVAGYTPAWSKLVYMAVGMDLPIDKILELDHAGDLFQQAQENPYTAR